MIPAYIRKLYEHSSFSPRELFPGCPDSGSVYDKLDLAAQVMFYTSHAGYEPFVRDAIEHRRFCARWETGEDAKLVKTLIDWLQATLSGTRHSEPSNPIELVSRESGYKVCDSRGAMVGTIYLSSSGYEFYPVTSMQGWTVDMLRQVAEKLEELNQTGTLLK